MLNAKITKIDRYHGKYTAHIEAIIIMSVVIATKAEQADKTDDELAGMTDDELAGMTDDELAEVTDDDELVGVAEEEALEEEDEVSRQRLRGAGRYSPLQRVKANMSIVGKSSKKVIVISCRSL